MADTPGIELKLDNGMVIKGENAEEALKSAAKIIEDNVKYSRETKAQLEQLQTQFQSLQAQQQQQQSRQIESNGGFDKTRYYQMLNEDPVEAQNYMDMHRFNLKRPSEVVERFNEMYEKVSAFEGQSLAAGFTNLHPEFPSDTDSAKALTGRVAELNRAGHPPDLHTMELAWGMLQNEGILKPIESESPGQEELPPSLGGAGSVMTEAEAKKVDNMSTKDLEAYLRSKGML